MKNTCDFEGFDSFLSESGTTVDEAYRRVKATMEADLAEHETKVKALTKQFQEEAKEASERWHVLLLGRIAEISAVFNQVGEALWSGVDTGLGRLKSLNADLLSQQPDHPPLFVVRPTEYAARLTPEMMMHLKESPEELRKLSPEVFEHLIGELLCSQGFEDVRLVGRNPSTSADVFAAKKVVPTGLDLRVFVEVKRRKRRIGIEVVNEVLGAMLAERPRYGWHAAFIVSLSGFRSLRRESPEQLRLQGVEFKEGTDIACWLDEYKLGNNGLWLANPKYDMPESKPTQRGRGSLK